MKPHMHAHDPIINPENMLALAYRMLQTDDIAEYTMSLLLVVAWTAWRHEALIPVSQAMLTALHDKFPDALDLMKEIAVSKEHLSTTAEIVTEAMSED